MLEIPRHSIVGSHEWTSTVAVGQNSQVESETGLVASGQPQSTTCRWHRSSVSAIERLGGPTNPAIAGSFRTFSGTPRKWRTAWWAREDSNLQPNRYERQACLGRSRKIRHLGARSSPFVRVWSTLFIANSLPVPRASAFARQRL